MKIGIVLVTFNRINDLKVTLEAYEKQSLLPEFVLVVDNYSTDGTVEYLKEWEAKENGVFPRKVAYLPSNVGGSGGFYHGMKLAMENAECDWVFVADDDAVPETQMLQKLVEFHDSHGELMKDTVALCTSVYNKDHYSGIHRCRLTKSVFGMVEKFVPEEEYEKEFFEIDIYSFVGTMIRKEVLSKAGLAREDFFIYNDDYEHACRVRKYGKMICVPSSVMMHVDNLNYTKEATWRDYYATRNAVIMHRTHFGNFYGMLRGMRRLLVALTTLNPEKIKVITTGIKDAKANKTGIHEVYKPGWKASRTHGL